MNSTSYPDSNFSSSGNVKSNDIMSPSNPNDQIVTHSPTHNDSKTDNDNKDNEVDSNEQLSIDLELFLKNPSIRSGLQDGSLDLKIFSNTIEDELNTIENECITIYKDQYHDILQLGNDLHECNIILNSLYEMLLGFQADLGGLSGDIRNLQDKSRKLDIQLRNRKSNELYLRQYLKHIILSPTVIHIIMNGTINMTFVKAIHELEEVIQSCSSSTTTTNWTCNNKPTQIKSIQEVLSVLKEIQMIAYKRIREYFLNQLSLLRSSQTNIRIIQQHGLYKYHMLHDFLEDIAPSNEYKNEIYDVYIETMNHTIQTLFRKYYSLLLCCDMTKLYVTRSDVIAVDDALLRDMMSTMKHKKNHKKYDPFSLNNRMKDCFGTITATTTIATASSATTSEPTATTSNDKNITLAGGKRMIGTRQQQSQTASALPRKATELKDHPNSLSSNDNNTDNEINDFSILNDPLIYSLQQQTPILAHVAIHENKQYPYECIFRSVIGHLVDSVTNEYIFCQQFFKRPVVDSDNNQHYETLHLLFNTTISTLLEQIENYLFHCYDAIAILLMIKLIHGYKRIMTYRNIYYLHNNFFDKVTYLLWPRLKTIIDNHIYSIQNASATSLGIIDLHPHYISRRMGEFCCSILLVLHTTNTTYSTISDNKINNDPSYNSIVRTSSKESSNSGNSRRFSTPIPRRKNNSNNVISSTSPTGTGDMIATSANTSSNSNSAGDKLLEDLNEMVSSFILLLERLSETHNTQKQRTVFLINNLDHIVCIFQERRVQHNTNTTAGTISSNNNYGSKEMNRFMDILMQQREVFVEEELLSTGFSKMIAFVQQTEAYIAHQQQQQGNANVSYDVNVSVIESLVLDFASNWKNNIEQINRNVLSYFSNFRNGMEILKQCLTQLLLYYTRFQDVIKKVYATSSSRNNLAKDLVSTSTILTEIKKYALSI